MPSTTSVIAILGRKLVRRISSQFLLGFGGCAEAYPDKGTEPPPGPRIPAGCAIGEVTLAAGGGALTCGGALGGTCGGAAGGTCGVGGCAAGVTGFAAGGCMGAGCGATGIGGGAAGFGVTGSATEGGGAFGGSAGAGGGGVTTVAGGETGFCSAAGFFSNSGMKRVTASSVGAADGLCSLAATAAGCSSSCSRFSTCC